MGFKCPLCNRDFEKRKTDFDAHIKQCNNGMAADFINDVKKTCERRENENDSRTNIR